MSLWKGRIKRDTCHLFISEHGISIRSYAAARRSEAIQSRLISSRRRGVLSKLFHGGFSRSPKSRPPLPRRLLRGINYDRQTLRLRVHPRGISSRTESFGGKSPMPAGWTAVARNEKLITRNFSPCRAI